MKKVAAEKRNLTDRTLQALKNKPAPRGERRTVWDGLLPGFGVRVTDKGRVSFFVFRRRAGGGDRLVRVTIGPYPAISLERARTIARGAVEDLAAGIDPREKRAAERRAEAQRRADTFAAVAEEFIKRHVRRLRSADQGEAVIRRELISKWGKRPVTEITRRDVTELLEQIKDRGTPYAAHHALALGRRLFNWAVARDSYGLVASPFDRVKAKEIIGAKEHRQRVLTDDELRIVWRAAEELDNPFGPFVHMLAITGQRLREIANVRWSEIDLDKKLLTVPTERMKGGAAHEVPLSPMAIGLLESLPRFKGDSFVFSTTGGRRPISGFSKCKKRLDKLIAQDGEMPRWVFHDLRRTVRTGLSALPVPDLVRELVIAHRKPGLHRVYDLHSYREEKRHALELWAERLRSIIEPPPKNVVRLRTVSK